MKNLFDFIYHQFFAIDKAKMLHNSWITLGISDYSAKLDLKTFWKNKDSHQRNKKCCPKVKLDS